MKAGKNDRMTRLAGIDIDAAARAVIPIFLLALLVVSAVAARLVRSATTRWLAAPAAIDPTRRRRRRWASRSAAPS